MPRIKHTHPTKRIPINKVSIITKSKKTKQPKKLTAKKEPMGGIKRVRKFHPGTVALREIKRY